MQCATSTCSLSRVPPPGSRSQRRQERTRGRAHVRVRLSRQDAALGRGAVTLAVWLVEPWSPGDLWLRRPSADA